ncbi:MAG: cysteine proteinase [Monoraphidium minutum]|nr:MAG: cysteine proteinase [Monoraphidium minutum]
MEWDFSMPYFMVLQPEGFKYRVKAWVDKAAESVRVDFNGGEQQTYFIGDEEFGVYPRKYERVCREHHHGGGPVKRRAAAAGGGSGGSSGAGGGAAGLLGVPVLPDMTGGDWENMGAAQVNGQDAVHWRLKRCQEGGEKTDEYNFYVTKEGAPLKLHSLGVDFFQGSHYDEYLYDFVSFKPAPVDASTFAPPEICKRGADLKADVSAGAGDASAGARDPGVLQAAALLPGALPANRDGAHYFGFSLQAGRQHRDGPDYAARLQAFAANKARIAAHNAAAAAGNPGAPTHTLALNRFADWSRAEFERVMLPNKMRRMVGVSQPPRAQGTPLAPVFNKTMTKGQLPTHVDWRGTPAEFGVKDQAQCGSCWAFAATGTMEGAWFVATGKGRSFSEQQLIDCAWDQGPNGCNGGDAQPGVDYVIKAGGVAQTQDYPYKGLNGFCRDNATKLVGRFKDYVQVPTRDEEAVMEALLKHGPLAVGVDAEHDFAFYSDGIYRETRCALKPKKLDHAVVLVGYGTTEGGEDYWIVRNSWSKFWGQDGYIFIHRRGNDCGIASDVAFARAADEALVPGAPERARALAVARGAALRAGCGGPTVPAAVAASRRR